MNRKEAERILRIYEELIGEDVRWSGDVRIFNSNPCILLNLELKEDHFLITYSEQIRNEKCDPKFDPKYVTYRHDEKTETLQFDDKRECFLFDWIESEANQLLLKLPEEQILEIQEYLKNHTIQHYSQEVTNIERDGDLITFNFTDGGSWAATRYSLHELYYSMHHAQHPEVELNRIWALRNFYTMWITFYPELEIDLLEDNCLFKRVQETYWKRYYERGIQSIKRLNWKVFLKKHDPEHYLEVVQNSLKPNKLRIQKLEAIAKMNDFELEEFCITEFDDKLFGPLGMFSEGCTEISDAQYAKLLLTIKDQMEGKEHAE